MEPFGGGARILNHSMRPDIDILRPDIDILRPKISRSIIMYKHYNAQGPPAYPDIHILRPDNDILRQHLTCKVFIYFRIPYIRTKIIFTGEKNIFRTYRGYLHINFPHVHSCLEHLYKGLLRRYLVIDDHRQMLHL